MGFWNIIDKMSSAVGKAAKTVVSAAKYVGEKVKDAGEWIERTISDLAWGQIAPRINTDFIENNHEPLDSSYIDEETVKAKMEQENEAISDYQNKVQQCAESRENDIKNTYLKIYKVYISDFKKVFDTELMEIIVSHVNQVSLSFSNTLRDEVNAKINPAYKPWKQLISSRPSPEKVQNYCDTIYKEAENHLLDLLQCSIRETNSVISNCIKKYNDDKAKALLELKKSLVRLTADEETRATEVKNLVEEMAVAQFITHETSIII